MPLTHVAGTVRFYSSIPETKLIEIASIMRGHNPGQWRDLHIRSAGDDGDHYIGFHYTLPDGEEATQRKEYNHLIELLRDQLGWNEKKNKPAGVDGWSISTINHLLA